MNSVTFDEVEKRVNLALNNFKERDLQLLELCADERASTHRIACYLQKYFQDWHVDCEYNRRGKRSKRQGGKLVRPDIIIHHRGIPENLLCIEAKKEGESLDDDRIKMSNFTDSTGEDRYQFGLLLVFSLNAPYNIDCKWYRDGNAI